MKVDTLVCNHMQCPDGAPSLLVHSHVCCMTIIAVPHWTLLTCCPLPFQAVDTMTTPINIPGLQLEGGTSAAGMPTTILCLMNMVSLDELRDDEEYEGMQTVVTPCRHKHLIQAELNTQEGCFTSSTTVSPQVELEYLE